MKSAPSSRRILPAAVLAAASLACRTEPASAPAAAEAAQAPAGSGDVGVAATAAAPAPAAPRPLPAFCAGAAEGPLPSSGATLVKGGFVFVEGPVWSAEHGAFFFSEMDFGRQGKDGPPSTIHKLVPPASVEVFIPEAGSNGLAIDEHGLVACTHDTRALSRYDLGTKRREVLAPGWQGKRFNSPNDVTLHSAGHIYFTDPDWQLGERPSETGVTGVYWRTPAGEVRLIDGGLKKPNGVTLSPDETRLYVGSVDGVVHAYQVHVDGSVSSRRELARVEEPDGMGVDCAGRLYVASHSGGEVVVLSPEGETLGRIPVAPKTTNVAFGGSDRKTLLITAGSGVYSLRSETPGLPY